MHLRQLKMVSLLILSILSSGLYGQFTIKGTVSDNSGSLIGVSVLLEGTSIGTATDLDGSFSLDIPSNSGVLQISYLGYRTQEFSISSDDSFFDIIMEEDINQLEEVIVTGLASGVKRSNSGNSVASLTAEQLVGNTSPQTLDNALFGKIAGVQMSANGGSPGGGVNVQLRGISTLGAGSSQPLYIIDGVLVNNSSIRTGRTQVSGASGGASAATQDDAANRIADINPDDIEKIEVLKGPSAAAIYGTRANAGVIIITTKRGKAGETSVTFSQDIGVAKGQNFQNFGIWDAQRTDDFSGGDAGELEAQRQAEAEGRNTDWEDFFYGETALLSNTQLGLSGGTEKTQFRVSAGILSEDGIIKNTGFERYSLRANIDHKLTDNIRASVSSMYSKTDNDRGFTGNQNNTGGSIGYNLAYTPSYANLFPDANGNYPNNPYFNDNPIAIRDLGVNNQKVDRFITSASLDFDLYQDENSFLKFKVNGGIDYLSGNSQVYFPENLQHQQAQANPGDVMWGRQDNFYANIQGFLTYNRSFGSISSNTSAGMVRIDQDSEFLLSRGRGLSGGQTNLRWATVQSVQSQQNQKVTDIGYVIQEDLNFDDKFIASVGVRFDKSTLNPQQDKLYAFPKASIAANLHNLGVVKSEGFINRLKLRAAYGETGGLPNFGVTYESLSPQLIGGGLGGQVGSRGVDPNLAPETASEFEFGLDAGFLNERITLEATLYNKTVRNLIFDITPPESTGITDIATNAGDLQNKGIELVLGINSIRSEKINMNTSFIFSSNDSKITRWDAPVQTLGGFGPSLGTYLFAEGFSPTTIVGNPTGTDDPLGFTVYGDRQPDFSLALANDISIGSNIDINFLLHYQKGGRAINLSALLWDLGGTTPNWNGDDDGDGTSNGNQRVGSWAGGNTGEYIEETSYVKLREIGIYYTLPQTFFGGVFDRFKVGVSANNVLLWTNYGSYDPEVSNFGTQAVTSNIEVTPYPSSRRLFFHIKAAF